MLNKNKKVKVGFISVLIVLVVVCVFILFKNKGKSIFNNKTNAKILSTWDIDMTPREKNIASWKKFVKKDDGMYIFGDGMIFKWDYKSAGYRPACDDPACDHLSDECPACFPVTKYNCVTYYNDHWIFVENEDNKRYFLGYCDFDGNNRKRVLDITDDIYGIDPWIYLDIADGNIYLSYNSGVDFKSDLGWEYKERLRVIKYDVSNIDSDKAYSEEVFLCEEADAVHMLSIDEKRFAVDVPETARIIGSRKYYDIRLYDQKEKNFITVEDAIDLLILPNGRYSAMTNEGLMLYDGDKTIRLEGEGWDVSFYDNNRIYAINTILRQIKSIDENCVIPDAEVKVYDYDGNFVDQVYLPKDFSLIDWIAAYDGRYYFTNIDYSTMSYFYVYDTQNPDKGWKKINKGY